MTSDDTSKIGMGLVFREEGDQFITGWVVGEHPNYYWVKWADGDPTSRVSKNSPSIIRFFGKAKSDDLPELRTA